MSLNNGYVVDYEILKKCATLPTIEELETHEDPYDIWEIAIPSCGYSGMHRIFKAIGIIDGDLEEGHWYICFDNEDLYETRKSSLGEALESADAFPDGIIWEDEID